MKSYSIKCENGYIINFKEYTCRDLFDCCDCGGMYCGCPYCWSCNACDYCLEND